MREDLPQFHAKPGDMWGIHDPAPFDADFKYRTSHPPEALDQDNYFLQCRSFFRRYTPKPGMNPYQAGDKIHATCILDDGTWQKATYEVSYVDDARVVVERISEWRRGGIVPEMKLKAKHMGFGKWTVFHENGKPMRSGLSKAEAERLVGHSLGAKAEQADAAD